MQTNWSYQYKSIEMKQLLLTTIILLATLLQTRAQQALEGFIYDEATGEALIGVSVFTADKKNGTATNAYGYFNLMVKQFDTLFFQYIGYQPHYILVTEFADIKVHLKAHAQTLKQAEVKAARFQPTQVSTYIMDMKQLNQIPAMGGERDLVKALQLMPGIKKGADGTATMLVRGGAQDQNLVLLDDAPVYNPTHLLGFFSLFNTDAVREASMQTGGFTANYGGRLSAVLDVHTLEGNNQKMEYNASVGLLASRLAVQGPLADGKGSFLVAGRISYIDKVFKAVGRNLPFYFYDFNTKLNYAITNRDRLYLSIYQGKDVLNDSREDAGSAISFGSKMGNQIASLRWNRAFVNKQMFSNLVLFSSRYSYDINASINQSTMSVNSQIADLGMRYTIHHRLSNNLNLKYGSEYIHHTFVPTTTKLTGDFNDNVKPQTRQVNLMSEAALFVTGDYQITKHWSTTMGLRATAAEAKQTRYTNIEPRLQLNYQFNKTNQLAFSYANMVQYMFLLSASSTFLPTDLWYGISAQIKPQKADIFSLSYHHTQNNYLTRIEAYYKPMFNLVEYREGTTDFVNANIEEHVVQGRGEAYGVEWFNRYHIEKLTVMFGYTLSWSNRTFNELNNGKTFFARFDRRHDLNLMLTYDFTKRIGLTGVWSYATGSRFTPVSGYFMMPAGNYNSIELLPIYTGRNAVQLSAAHKLDVNLIIKSSENKKLKWECHVGAYNVYNQTQPFRIKIEDNPDGTKSYKQVGLFGFIPSVSYQVKF